jgi:hypothetical protein
MAREKEKKRKKKKEKKEKEIPLSRAASLGRLRGASERQGNTTKGKNGEIRKCEFS